MTTFERQLEDDLDWRWAELAFLKKQVLAGSRGTLPYRTLLRAIMAMLYAHYEGYCLFALGVYLEELEKRNEARACFREPLVVFSMEKEFRQLRRNLSGTSCYEFFGRKLHQLMRETLVFKKDPNKGEYILKGDGNLYPKQLAETCDTVCLTVPAIENHKTELWTLVNRRNGIAHGEKVEIKDLSEYLPIESAASNVMYELTYAILDAVSDLSFLKKELEYYI